MPCYTVVQVQIQDKAMAEKALKKLKIEATITRNARGTFTVEPKEYISDFQDTFMQRYTVEVTKKQALKDGYMLQEKTNTKGETELYLRQY